MQNTFFFIFAAIILGTTAGISPGPLLALVISETVKYGKKEGYKLALVPFITDLPIVFISIFFLSTITRNQIILGIISLLGCAFLIYLAWNSIFFKKEDSSFNVKSQSLKKGIIANFLSPHPYLFWIFVGGKYALDAYNNNLTTAVLFFVFFYISLSGSKIVIAWLTEKFRSIMSTNVYVYTIRILGIILILIAFQLLWEGVNYIL